MRSAAAVDAWHVQRGPAGEQVALPVSAVLVNPAPRPRVAPRVVGATVVGVVVLGAGWGLWRHWRRQQAIAETSENLGTLGIALPSWLTGKQASQSLYDLWAAASRQVAAAKKGQRLADYRQAEDLKLFWSTATNKAGGWVKTAFWLAVASRVAGSNELGKAASRNLAQATGQAASLLPDLSDDLGEVHRIYAEAAELVHQAGDTAQLRAVARILERQGDARVLTAAEANQQDRQVVRNTLARSGEDVATIAAAARGVFTGERPQALSPTHWAFLKWGLRIGLAGVVLLGVGLVLRPHIQAARSAATAGLQVARRGYQAMQPELGAAGEVLRRAYAHARGATR